MKRVSELSNVGQPSPPDKHEIVLPNKDILDAGLAKFTELCQLNWPNSSGTFGLVQFDVRNPQHMRITLGLVYMAMREIEDGNPIRQAG